MAGVDLAGNLTGGGSLNARSTKDSVRLVETASNVTLSGNQTIDGVLTAPGDRVGVFGQSTPAEDGIYVTAAGAWKRASDFKAGSGQAGASFVCEDGTVNANVLFVVTNLQGSDVVGTDDLTVAPISGGVEDVTSGSPLLIEVNPTTGNVVVTAKNQVLDTTNAGWGTTALGSVTGARNTAFGVNAGASITSQNQNTALGYEAFLSATPVDATALGYQAGRESAGAGGVYAGIQAGRNIDSTGWVVLGRRAVDGAAAKTNGLGIAIGNDNSRNISGALVNYLSIGAVSCTNITASNDVCSIGSFSLRNATDPDRIVALGNNVGDNITTGGKDSVYLGQGLDASSATVNDELMIGNNSGEFITGTMPGAGNRRALRIGGSGAIANDYVLLDLESNTQVMKLPTPSLAARDLVSPVANGMLAYVQGTIPGVHARVQGVWTYLSAALDTRLVRAASDFPAAVGGVRTLAPLTVYIIESPTAINIGTDKIEVTSNAVILGRTRFIDGITSSNASETILNQTAGVILTLQRLNVRNTGGGSSVRLNNATAIVDATDCIFNANVRLTLKDQCTFTACEWNSAGILVDGTGGDLVVRGSTFDQQPVAGAPVGLDIPVGGGLDTLVVDGCTFVLTDADSHGIRVNNQNQVGEATVELSNWTDVNGTELTGVNSASNNWQFNGNKGVSNSLDQGTSTTTSVATIPLTQNVWADVTDAGTAVTWTLDAAAEKFSLSNANTGELTYNGPPTKSFKFSAAINLTRIGGQDVDIQMGVSLNGAAPIARSINAIDLGNATTFQIVTATFAQQLSTGDTVKLQIRNVTAGTPGNNDVTLERGILTVVA